MAWIVEMIHCGLKDIEMAHILPNARATPGKNRHI
jgi:hypothetical protein